MFKTVAVSITKKLYNSKNMLYFVNSIKKHFYIHVSRMSEYENILLRNNNFSFGNYKYLNIILYINR